MAGSAHGERVPTRVAGKLRACRRTRMGQAPVVRNAGVRRLNLQSASETIQNLSAELTSLRRLPRLWEQVVGSCHALSNTHTPVKSFAQK